MIIDAKSLAVNSEINGDIVIVGAGPAGIALALSLAALNKSIIVLESGGERREPFTDLLNEGESTAPLIHAVPSLYRTRVLGGASSIWGGRCVPLDAIDFEKRDWVPYSGWPITVNEISRWLSEATQFLEAGAAIFDDSALQSCTEFIDGFHDDRVLINLERFSPPTNAGRRYKRDLETSPNVRVITHATCVELVQTLDDQHINKLVCCRPDGSQFVARGRFYVIAAGGLETTRLLLASTSCDEQGVGNKHDLVGRFYMCHIEGTLGEIALQPPKRRVQWGFERTSEGVYARRKLQLKPEVQRRELLLNSMIRLHHPIASNPAHGIAILSLMYLVKRFIIPEYRRKLAMIDLAEIAKRSGEARHYIAHLRNLVFDAPRLSSFTLNWIVQRYLRYRRIPYVALESPDGRYPIDFNGEQIPNPSSRVYLGQEKDRFGVPQLIVDWKMTDQDINSIIKTFHIWQSILKKSGVGTLVLDSEKFPDLVKASVPVGGHHIGTTRMSTNPTEGVVDENCKVHGIDNLFIAGASVFPTTGHANPTLSVVALAMRLGTHLQSLILTRG